MLESWARGFCLALALELKTPDLPLEMEQEGLVSTLRSITRCRLSGTELLQYMVGHTETQDSELRFTEEAASFI